MRGNGLFIVVGSARGVAAEIVPVAAHRERGRADAAAKVEGKDLRTRITPELECYQRQQHGLSRAGRADDQRVADVTDMKGKPERGRALRLAEQQGGCIEVLVPFRPRPDRRERDHVGEIEGGNRRLAHIGVSLAGQRSKPRFDRIDAFGDAGEIAALDDFLDQPELLGCHAGVPIPHRHRGGDIDLADIVRPELLQGHVGVGGFVGGVGVDQDGGLVGHHLFQDRGDAFPFGEPLAADLGQQPDGVGLVD